MKLKSQNGGGAKSGRRGVVRHARTRRSGPTFSASVPCFISRRVPFGSLTEGKHQRNADFLLTLSYFYRQNPISRPLMWFTSCAQSRDRPLPHSSLLQRRLLAKSDNTYQLSDRVSHSGPRACCDLVSQVSVSLLPSLPAFASQSTPPPPAASGNQIIQKRDLG